MHAIGLSNIGRVRKQNQDSIFVSDTPVGPLPNLYIVADGMGGHNAGEVASQQAIALFTDYIKNHTAQPADFLDLCVSAAGYANYGIYRQAAAQPALNGMGTTFSACFILNNQCQIVHVGDSRVYKISTDTLTQLTQDHSYVNEMLKAGHITQKQARQHPKRNILTRVMGVDEFMEVDGYACVLDDACTVLLCSDGLYGMISDEEMTHLATAPTPAEHRARALVEAANAAGGTDNISVILINR